MGFGGTEPPASLQRFCDGPHDCYADVSGPAHASFTKGCQRHLVLDNGSVNYRSLGRTGYQVSEISFGAWAIGGAWGTVDDSESMSALHQAVDSGINFIDTADVYGMGRSERLIAQLKRDRKEEIVVAIPLRATTKQTSPRSLKTVSATWKSIVSIWSSSIAPRPQFIIARKYSEFWIAWWRPVSFVTMVSVSRR